MAIILGLHREPQEDLDENTKDFHRRIWWTLYAFELKAAMELGRPIGVNMSQVTCRLPSSNVPTGLIRPDGLTKPGKTGFHLALCYACNLHLVKLVFTFRSVYVAFYFKGVELMGRSHQSSLYGNPHVLESCAEFLQMKWEYLDVWVRDLPTSLKMGRRNGGKAMSTDGSPMDIQPSVPFVQQRQQIFLELHFHTVALNLYRPFICSYPPPQGHETTPLSEAHALACVDHALTIVQIVHQLITETEILSGWLETFQWHNNAFISLLGYMVSTPSGPRTPEIRRAVREAIATFDLLSSSLAMASSAAKTARELAANADALIEMAQFVPENFSSEAVSAEFIEQLIMQVDSNTECSVSGDPQASKEATNWTSMAIPSATGVDPAEWIDISMSTPQVWNMESEFSTQDPFLTWAAGFNVFGYDL